MHGGTIEVQSEGTGKGTRFTVLLPIVAVGTPPDPVAKPGQEFFAPALFPTDRLRGLHVMVLDDEVTVRVLLALTLSKCGASVTLATSVEHALALLPNLSPDVVVSDIAMPDVDGYEFIRRLRRLVARRTAALPVIALTAYASAQDRERVLEAGFDGYLTKPVDPAELVRAIAITHTGSREHPR
jgi:CheY-like chemotaxis protein